MTVKMTSAQVVETSVIVNNNSSFQNYTHPDDHKRQTTDTPGFKPFTKLHVYLRKNAVDIWPVTGQGFQNTKWPAVLYSQ